MPGTYGRLRPVALLIMLAFTAHLGLCLSCHHVGEPPHSMPSVSAPGGEPAAAPHPPHDTTWMAAHPRGPAAPYPEPAHARHGRACHTLNPASARVGMNGGLLRCMSAAPCFLAGPVAAASPDPAVTGTVMLTLLCVSRT